MYSPRSTIELHTSIKEIGVPSPQPCLGAMDVPHLQCLAGRMLRYRSQRYQEKLDGMVLGMI